MRVLYLANSIPWFGNHTGYERLPSYVEREGVPIESYSPEPGLLSRAVGKAVSLVRGHGSVSQSDASSRLRLELGLRRHPDSVGHILYGEEHIPFWGDAPEALRRRTVVTLHQPAVARFPEKNAALRLLPHVIVLWQREIDWFRDHLKGGDVHFVHHGVDIDFFSSAAPTAATPGPPRLLYVGVHLRNFEMLARLIPCLLERRKDLQFDLLVPENRRNEPGLSTLLGHPNIRWHAGVDDVGLRDLYRSAHLLFLPLNDSGANTAVVEALACGLPVVTTDVGGIRDYGGGTVFPVVENNDDEGMLTLIDRYLASPAWRDEMGCRCRAFAEEQLAWPIVARRHLEIYQKVRS